MIYEIFTYGGGDYLVEVLNGIVRIMGDNSFTTALKIFLLFGLFSIMFDIALNGNFTKSVKYYISFFLIYNILFVPKVDVLIVDPINQIQGDRKVDNVPFGLGLSAHTITLLGNWMTKVFGMNFVLPNDLQYNKNGILFGSSIVKDTLNKKISDITISSNFNNYIRQCIVPAVNLKRINVEDIFKADNLQDFLALGHNGVLAYTYESSAGSSIVLCNDTTTLYQKINDEISELMQQQDNVFNKNNNANITDINQYILGISQSTQKTFEQSLLTNAISDSAQEYLSITGADAGATNYAITKDNMQRKTNSILQWLQAGEFLPLLKVIMEAFFYGIFPIIILMTMLPNGIRYFKYYILILLALQVWSPLYAILNLIMTLEQKYKISGIVSETGSTLSLYNKEAIMDITQRIQMQAGLLAFLIPPLSFKIVQGMHGFGESIASGVASAGSYATSQVVSEVASGSLSYGNTAFKNTNYGNESFDNIQGHKHDTMSYERGADGIGISAGKFVQVMKDDLGVDVSRSERKSVSYAKSLSNAESILKAKSQDRSNAESDFNSYVSSHRNDIIKSVNESDAISNEDKKSITGSLNIDVSGGFKLFGNGLKMGARAEAAWGKYLSHAKNISESQGNNDTIANEISKRHDKVISTTKAEREAIDDVSAKRKEYNNALSSDAMITRNINNETFESLSIEDKKKFAMNDAGKINLANMGQKKAFGEFQNTVEPMLLDYNNKKKNTEDSLKN